MGEALFVSVLCGGIAGILVFILPWPQTAPVRDIEAETLLNEIALLNAAAEAAEKFAPALHREHAELLGPHAALKHAMSLLNAARTGWQSKHSLERHQLLLEGEVLRASNDRDVRWIEAFFTAQERTKLVGGKSKKEPALELQTDLRTIIDERKADGKETRSHEDLLFALERYAASRARDD